MNGKGGGKLQRFDCFCRRWRVAFFAVISCKCAAESAVACNLYQRLASSASLQTLCSGQPLTAITLRNHRRTSMHGKLASGHCKALAITRNAHAAVRVPFSSLMVQRDRWDTYWGPKKVISCFAVPRPTTPQAGRAGLILSIPAE